MTETTNHGHLEWAIRSRYRNQVSCLKLLHLFDEDPSYWRTKKASRAAQELIAICFSLWRAAFLADKTGKRSQVFAHGRDFLERLIEDNAIAYPQDKKAREWTFNYYTKNARNSLETLGKYWGPSFPQYEGATRNAVERWDYCQGLLDRALDHFAELLQTAKSLQDDKEAARETRSAAKARRRDVRELTAADRRSRPTGKLRTPSA